MRKFLLLLCTAIASLTSYADTWTKVTSASDLTTDGEYLLVCESNNAVMGNAPIGTNKYMPIVSVSNLAGGSIETDGSETFGVVTFEGALNSCKVKISTLGGIVKGYYTTSAAKNMSLSNNGTSATVSFSNNNIEINFGTTLGSLQYNASRFLNYTSNQTAIQIYKKDAGSTKIPVTLSYPEPGYTVNFGESFSSPALTVTPAEAISEVVYESSATNVATIDENGTVSIAGIGTTTISASISGSETYGNGYAEYVLSVIDPNNPSEKIVFANNGYTDQKVISTVNQGKITLLFDQGSNTNKPKYFNNGKDVRLYGGGSLTISVPAEYVLTKVISIYNNTKNKLSADNGEFNSDYTIWTAGATTKNTVVFTESGTSGNRSWTEIEVYYTKASDPSKGDVTLTFDNSEDMTEAFEAGKTVQGRVATADVQGLEITYSSSDKAVATVDAASGMLTLVGPGSTTITAQTAETTEYNAGHASYTLNVEIIYNSIADVLNYANNNDIIDLNFAMTVGHVNGKYVFVTDNKGGYILIYEQTEYTANDVIPAGMKAKYTIYNGLPELAPQTQPAATEKGTYEIETVAATEVMNQPLNKIIIVENVTFAEATPASGAFTGVSGATDLNFYNQMKLSSVEAGNYDVMVNVSTHKSKATEIDAPSQLQPLEYYALPGVATATIGDTEIAESYELTGSEVTVVLTAPKGESIWYKFTATPTTPEAGQALEGFTEYPAEGIKIGQQGTLEYYTELNGRTSDVSLIEFTGTPAAISEITADGAAAEWYDLSGRRVATPTKGVFIKKIGSKVSKYVF